VNDPPRFLAKGLGYTTHPGRALRGEPEALSEEALDELAIRARIRERELRINDSRPRLQLIRQELTHIKVAGPRNVRRQVRAVEHQVDVLGKLLA
jgi:hypothetical protein